MRNVRMVVSYEGTNYNGFQTQPSGNTIQDVIEAGIYDLTRENIRINGSGRTDAGVHARGQVFNFHTESKIPVERWALALNSRLPDDIVILAADEVPFDFHARFSAKRKTYRYAIDKNPFPDVFRRRFSFHHHAPLHVPAMRLALMALVGEHDFTSFASTQSTQLSHVRTIYAGSIEEGEGSLDIFVTGNGFLYNMVRIIAGTLIEVGEGKLDPAAMADILAAKNRTAAGPTAMAHGLTLWNVAYD